MKLFSMFGGQLRRRRNIRDMRKTLERSRLSSRDHRG